MESSFQLMNYDCSFANISCLVTDAIIIFSIKFISYRLKIKLIVLFHLE